MKILINLRANYKIENQQFTKTLVRISPDENTYAKTKGVTLIETPIALNGFIFVVNKNNPVKSMTVEQIQKIYTGEISNWQQVGGNNASIKVFTRPRNSGSEEVFREVVMDGLDPAEFPESTIGSTCSHSFRFRP